MNENTKFARMLALLRSDHKAQQKLLTDPVSLFEEMGVSKAALNAAENEQALARTKALLSDAGITTKDDIVSGLKKVGIAAKKHFKNGFEVEVHPFGIVLLEHPIETQLDWTATGGVTCTYSPWDGCSPDPDS